MDMDELNDVDARLSTTGSRIGILTCGRREKPFRPVQIEALQWFEKVWDENDVFVFEAPTATGKSMMVTTIARWLSVIGSRASIITPTKLLQDQYLKDFVEIPVLKGQAAYTCDQNGLQGTCRETKQHVGNCCVGEGGMMVCPYLIARAEASAANVALFNFHSYYANKMYKDTLIADEAHNAIGFLFDFYSLKLWKCEVGYADDLQLDSASIRDLIKATIKSLSDTLIDWSVSGVGDSQKEALEKEIERLTYIQSTIDYYKNDLLIEKDKEEYRGKKKEFKGTEQEYIYVKPLKIDKMGNDLLWPKSPVQKIILLSATIFPLDLETLGLNGKKVAYFRCGSPIPPENRPFVIWPVASMKWSNRAASLPKMVEGIRTLAKLHHDTKGVIHCTYELNRKLESAFGHDPRFWFHTNQNKMEKYNQFRAATGNQIFVASGMDEGIDLAFDAGRWQVLTQLMRPNIADKVNKWMANNRPMAYHLETVRKVIQQTGRICRDPTDIGITYMIDSEFYSLWGQAKDLFSQWFIDAMIWPKK